MSQAAHAAPRKTSLPGEYFAIIADFPNYMVSNLGRVLRAENGPDKIRAARFKEIRQRTHTKKGCRQVNLHSGCVIKTFAVHRLVMDAFVGPRPRTHEVKHIDADFRNNVLVNLQYRPRSRKPHYVKALAQAVA